MAIATAGSRDWRFWLAWLGLVGVVVLATVMFSGIHRYEATLDAEGAFLLGSLLMLFLHFGSWLLFPVGAPECWGTALATMLALGAAFCVSAAEPVPVYWVS